MDSGDKVVERSARFIQARFDLRIGGKFRRVRRENDDRDGRTAAAPQFRQQFKAGNRTDRDIDHRKVKLTGEQSPAALFDGAN